MNLLKFLSKESRRKREVLGLEHEIRIKLLNKVLADIEARNEVLK